MKIGRPSNEIVRLIRAFGHSAEGLKAACTEPAFRVELALAGLLIPVAFLLEISRSEKALLVGSVCFVLAVELLNTGIEAAINRVSSEWHPLSKRAKDVGSAAVLAALINAGLIWLIVLW